MTGFFYTLILAAFACFLFCLLPATCGSAQQRVTWGAVAALCFLAMCFLILIGATTGHL